MPSSDVDVDSILITLKYCGWYQIIQFMLANFSGLIVYTNNLLFIFIAILPEFQCRNLTESQLSIYNISEDGNLVEYHQCHVLIKPNNYENVSSSSEILSLVCPNGYSYTTPVDKTIVSEWDLVCGRKGLAELSQTIYVLGQFVGSLFWPIQMEHFGRRPIHLICNILILPLNILSSYSMFFWLFTMTRFFNGFLIQGFLISTCTVLTEMFPAQKRNWMTGLSSLLFSFMILIFELTVYLLRNKSWRMLVLCCAGFSLYGFIELLFFKESLRWLFATGKVERAQEMMKYAAKLNNSSYDEAWQIALKNIDLEPEPECTELVETQQPHEQEGNNKYSASAEEEKIPESKKTTKLLEESKNCRPGAVDKNQGERTQSKTGWIGIIPIMQFSYTRTLSFIIMTTWLVITVTYHSFFFLSETLVGNIYLNFLFLCLMEILSCIIYWPAIVRFGHKKPLATTIFSGSIFLLIAALLKAFGGDWAATNFYFMLVFMLAMLGIGSAFGGLYLYTPELYPTEVRSVGLGLCSAAARLGHMMAPFSRILASNYPWAPSTISGITCIFIAFLLIYALPETFKKRLPQTMEELKQNRIKSKLLLLQGAKI